MVEILKEILDKTEGADAWKIIDQETEGRELFFVRRSLDMSRAGKVRRISVTVYHDFQEGGRRYRGSVTARIQPTHTREEVKRIVKESVFAAGFVKNEYYPLPEPAGERGAGFQKGSQSAKIPVSLFSSRPLGDWLEPLTEEVFKEDTGGTGGINSAELFLNEVRTRILNSSGVDGQYSSYKGLLELITEWKGEREDVELYKEILFSDFLPKLISEEVKKQLSLSRDRSLAEPTPSLKSSTVLLTGDPVSEFFQYYLSQSSAKSVYEQLSTLKPGEPVQGDNIKGDALNLKLLPYLPNSPLSAPYDEDGFSLLPVSIIEEGVLKRYWGPIRFTHYLGSEPTGNLKNVTVLPGDRPASELRAGSGLEVVSFSDFQCDPITGDFGGEIRLGYCTDRKDRLPVTGGSVSGNVRDIKQERYFSREVQSAASFSGPETIRLSNVRVTGAG